MTRCIHLMCIMLISCSPGHEQKSRENEIASGGNTSDRACRRTEGLLREARITRLADQLQSQIKMDRSDFVNGVMLSLYSGYGDREQVMRLLRSGVNPNFNTPAGDGFSPPLAWAARCGRDDIVTLLLKSGADPNLKFSYVEPAGVRHDSTPTIWARLAQKPSTLKIILSYGGDSGKKKRSAAFYLSPLRRARQSTIASRNDFFIGLRELRGHGAGSR